MTYKMLPGFIALLICGTPAPSWAYFVYDAAHPAAYPEVSASTASVPTPRSLPFSPAPAGGQQPSGAVQPTEASLLVAVALNLPAGWTYEIDTDEHRQLMVTWDSSREWKDRIRQMAGQADCQAVFDDSARKLFLGGALHPKTTVTSAQSGVVESIPLSSAPTPVMPISEVSLPVSATPYAPTLKDEDAISVLEAEPTLEQWTLSPGSLYAQLEAWCERAGFQLVWKPAHDLDMEARAEFRGGFTDAVGRLFQGLHKSGNALRVTIYSANNVVEISEE